ncbi:MAG: ATP-binding protein [Gammaproteobacteria bacterium]
MMKFTSLLTRQLLDLAPDATIIVNRDGEIVFTNARTESVLGYLPDELFGQKVEVLLPERFRSKHPGFRHGFFENSRPRAMGEGLELWALRKDGAEIPVEISLSPVDTDEGMIVCAAIRDTSDRYEIQKQLKAAKQEADRANNAKSHFLAAASHDLRQPLQTLNMLNGVLKRVINSSTTLQVVDDQRIALDSVADMLNSLLDISKLEAGVIVPDMHDHSVQRIFEGLRKQFAALAETKGLELVVDDCHETIHSDPGLLMQILYNLVSNAIRYTNAGQVNIRCLHDETCIMLQVVDTGIGIPLNEIETVFSEFYRIHHGPEYIEGFGLGLTIVRRLTDLLGHRLELDSKPGKGTCFSIIVPRGVLSGQPELPVSFAARRSTDRMVLMIDDSLPVLDSTRTLLEIEGFRTITASNGEQAIKLLKNGERQPDIIICDFHIPGTGNGVDLIGELRKLAGEDIPVIMITGDTSTSARKIMDTIDHCTMLNKPIDIDKLLETIHSAIL